MPKVRLMTMKAKSSYTTKVIVVGAGPAGMMAAIRAAQRGARVTLIDKNPAPGRKLLLTGGGRCNLTNACDPGDLISKFSRTGSFLRDAFRTFSNKDLMEFFEERGLRLKTEDMGRVFPADDKASSVLSVLEKEIGRLGVETLYGLSVKEMLVKEGRAGGVVFSDGKAIRCDDLVLATGGLSYGETGSTGEGIEMASRSGHEIIPVRPGLAGLETDGDIPGALEGLTVDDVRLTFRCGKKKITSERDSLLFTARGISGPVVISMSGKVADLFKKSGKTEVSIDLMPSISQDEAEKQLLRKFGANPGMIIKNVIVSMLPERLAGAVIKMSGVSAAKRANQVTAAERKKIVSLIKGMRLRITGAAPLKTAMITRGGVSVRDIDPRTMESRKIKGLYFAGEMLDVDADTGGYNLQAAFSTGYLAGQSAAKR
jgi:predicted Rossmann fold flavoprotein